MTDTAILATGLAVQCVTLVLVLRWPRSLLTRVEDSNKTVGAVFERVLKSNGDVRHLIEVRRDEDAQMHAENLALGVECRSLRGDVILALTEVQRWRREAGMDTAFLPHSDRDRSA